MTEVEPYHLVDFGSEKQQSGFNEKAQTPLCPTVPAIVENATDGTSLMTLDFPDLPAGKLYLVIGKTRYRLIPA